MVKQGIGLFAAIAALFVILISPVSAADKIRTGAIGSASPLGWPFYIGMSKGFFAAEGLEFDIVYVQSAPNLLQQLSADSLDLAISSGLVDPIRAMVKGGPVALVLVEVQAAPYVLMGQPEIKNLGALRGKTVAVGGFNDITNIYLDRMLAPSGMKRGDFDMKFFGSTPARLAALQAKAVDAAMLSQPGNFYAAAAGYTNLGLVKDYVGEFPFSGSAVNRAWAEAHREDVRKLIAVYVKGVAWFRDPANRDESIKIMVEASQGRPEDVTQSYDFLRNGDFFAATGAVSKSKLGNLVNAMHDLGDIEVVPPIERLVIPGLTPVME